MAATKIIAGVTDLLKGLETVTVTIRFTDGVKEREAFYLKLLKTTIDDEKLSDLRTNIAGLTGSIEISHFPFCGKKGAIVPDSFFVQEYLRECLGINTATAKTMDIYMRDSMVSETLESVKHIIPACELAGAPVGSVIDAEKLARLKGMVNETAFKQLTGTAAKYVPELEQKDWAVISESNALCYGIRVIRSRSADQPAGGTDGSKQATNTADQRGIAVGIERARFPAFILKKRTIMSDSIPSSAIEGVRLNLRIPDYIIDDKSYVSIYETETEMQSSMATSSFSEIDVEAAGGLSGFGMSGSVSASFASTSSEAASSASSKKSKKVTIAYNFPRVTLFLDSRSLELTRECEDALRKVKSKQDLHKFQDNYGEFFSTRVQLGGRLFATEDVTKETAGGSSGMAKSMKAAAAASFSSTFVNASVSASYGSKEKSTEKESSASSAMSLTWQANGGDTLLCNKPNEWAETVSYHWNWRITKQDNIFRLLDVMCQIDGIDWLIPEAAKWGVKVSPIDEANVFRNRLAWGQTFTLNIEGVPEGRYLLTFPPTACDLCQSPFSRWVTYSMLTTTAAFAARAMNATRKYSFSINSSLQANGCALLGPKTAKSKETLRLYEVEDASGMVMKDVRYNTKYRLRNKETGMFLSYFWHQEFRFAYSSAHRSPVRFIAFKDPKGSTSTDVIPDGSAVTVRFYEVKDGEVLGYLLVAAVDNEYAYLGASKPDDTSKNEVKLIVRYI
ncbi:hypothetical protein CP533_3920 [Ophiocordyceps camponoti-saundersi (nom. inval.)]|nr:hypothetical protein CP533_3920 [Ophiocordyceps camponoti-saundersi (nom. inval.)]